MTTLPTSPALKWRVTSIPYIVTFPGTSGPRMPQTLERIKTKVKPGNSSARPTQRNLENPKVSVPDLYLAQHSRPLSNGHHNHSLDAHSKVVLFIMGPFFMVLELCALQDSESYEKKDYRYMDALTKSMHTGSEM